MGMEFMGQHGIVDADPEGFRQSVSEERDNQDPKSGRHEGGSQAEQTEEEGQADWKNPTQAGQGIIEGDGPQAPAVLLFQG